MVVVPSIVYHAGHEGIDCCITRPACANKRRTQCKFLFKRGSAVEIMVLNFS